MGCSFHRKVYLYLDSSKTTKSTEVYGPKPAVEYLILQKKYLMPIVRKYRGNVTYLVWDSFHAEFDDAVDAVNAAIEIREVYQTNDEFLEINRNAKIALAGLSISYDHQFNEELGEN